MAFLSSSCSPPFNPSLASASRAFWASLCAFFVFPLDGARSFVVGWADERDLDGVLARPAFVGGGRAEARWEGGKGVRDPGESEREQGTS